MENAGTGTGASSKSSTSVKPSVANDKGKKKKAGVTFADPGPSQRQQQRSKPVNVNNIKKEKLMQLIQRKKECDRKAHDIVLRLIETDVEKEYLLDNAISISKQHIEDVIEERKLSQLCGWVLCNNPIDLENIPKQTYSIRGHKVYDITERKAFCDAKCYAKSTHFKAQLLTSPLWLRDLEEDVHFEILKESDTAALHGMTVSFSSVNLSDDDSSEDENNEKVSEKRQILVNSFFTLFIIFFQ